MNPAYKKEKLFILSRILWGLLQVACGLFVLVLELGNRGHNSSLSNPLLVMAASASYITAGKCTIAFSYFRGKLLMVAVVLFSALSINFGVIQFILLVTYPHGKKSLGHDSVQECTIETVIFFGSIFKATFLFVFIRKCLTSTPAFVHLEEDTESPPPPPPAYDDTIMAGDQECLETNSFPPPPAYDTLETGDQESHEDTSPPPVYTNDDWTRYQENINLAWQGEC